MGSKQPTARTPEERENQLINKAYNLVEKRIDEGTASSQETSHFLKMGSSRARLEERRLEGEVRLIEAKTKALHEVSEFKVIVENAMTVMTRYQGKDESVVETYE